MFVFLFFCIYFFFYCFFFFFFFQAEDGIRDLYVTGVQTCALPIFTGTSASSGASLCACTRACVPCGVTRTRSEEHTSELQSRRDLVCRLLLEKKKRRVSCRMAAWRRSVRPPCHSRTRCRSGTERRG